MFLVVQQQERIIMNCGEFWQAAIFRHFICSLLCKAKEKIQTGTIQSVAQIHDCSLVLVVGFSTTL